MRLSVAEGALATAMGTLQSGAFLTGFALLLGASPLQVGILAALPTLASVLQAAGSFWLSGVPRKRLCVRSFIASRLMWAPILLVPALSLWDQGAAGVWCIIAMLAAGSIFNAIGGVAWLSWIRDLIPDQKRIGFFARRNQLDTVFALSLSIAGAAFVDWWQQAFPQSALGYVVVFGVGIACGLLGVLLLNAIPDEQEETASETISLATVFHAPLRDSQFRRLLTFYSAWNLAVQIAAPFFVVYMLQKLALPLWYVTVLHTLGSVGALVTNRLWVRWSEKYGVQPVVFAATLVDALFPLAWLFITPATAWILPLVFLINLVNAPLATGPINLVFRMAPRHKAPTYMGQLNAVIGLVGGLAAILGGYLAGLLTVESSAVSLLGGWEPLKILFLLSFVGRFASLFLLARVSDADVATIAEAAAASGSEQPSLALSAASSTPAMDIAVADVLENAA
jgi:MFS family permease